MSSAASVPANPPQGQTLERPTQACVPKFKVGDRVRIRFTDLIDVTPALAETYYSVTGAEHTIASLFHHPLVPGEYWYSLDTPPFVYIADALTLVGQRRLTRKSGRYA